jgi:transcription elongation factor GreA
VVGSQEADPITGKISDDSPFGKGLMGHKVGDIVEVEAPAGRLKFEILNIGK